MKKAIEEKTSMKGADAASIQERENQLNHHLELITNIAQRIENENRTLMEKNKELQNDYKAQENDRELLLRQLVNLKKENAKVSEEIDNYDRIIEKDEPEESLMTESEAPSLRIHSSAAKTMDAKARVDHRNETEQEKID